MLNGEKFKTDRVEISWRGSEQVQTDEDFILWALENNAYLRFKEPEVDRAALKDALKQGIEVPHAVLVENQNIQIK